MVNRFPSAVASAGMPPNGRIETTVGSGSRSGELSWIVWLTDVPCLTSVMSETTSVGLGAATTWMVMSLAVSGKPSTATRRRPVCSGTALDPAATVTTWPCGVAVTSVRPSAQSAVNVSPAAVAGSGVQRVQTAPMRRSTGAPPWVSLWVHEGQRSTGVAEPT